MSQRSPLVREAFQWFALLRDVDARESDRQDFARWLAQGPEHEAAWEHAQQLWDRFAPVETALSGERRRKMGRRALLGSAAFLFTAGATSWWILRSPEANYQTRPGQRLAFDLPDGSRLELGADTAVAEAFSGDERRLVLLRGEAYFTVAPDPLRPFVVTTGPGRIRALGTQFNVHSGGDRVTVAVLEHSVEVTSPTGEAAVIAEGMQGGFSRDQLLPPTAVDTLSVAAWRQGRLVYHDVPLARVLADLQRYTGEAVVLTNPAVGDAAVSGAFALDSIGTALDTITASLGLEQVRVGSLVLLFGG